MKNYICTTITTNTSWWHDALFFGAWNFFLRVFSWKPCSSFKQRDHYSAISAAAAFLCSFLCVYVIVLTSTTTRWVQVKEKASRSRCVVSQAGASRQLAYSESRPRKGHHSNGLISVSKLDLSLEWSWEATIEEGKENVIHASGMIFSQPTISYKKQFKSFFSIYSLGTLTLDLFMLQ